MVDKFVRGSDFCVIYFLPTNVNAGRANRTIPPPDCFLLTAFTSIINEIA